MKETQRGRKKKKKKKESEHDSSSSFSSSLCSNAQAALPVDNSAWGDTETDTVGIRVSAVMFAHRLRDWLCAPPPPIDPSTFT
jgi:hypothetical protein